MKQKKLLEDVVRIIEKIIAKPGGCFSDSELASLQLAKTKLEECIETFPEFWSTDHIKEYALIMKPVVELISMAFRLYSGE